MRKLVLSLLFIATISNATDSNGRAEGVIKKSSETRLKLEKKYSNKKERIPASIQSNFDEFERLMHSDEDKNWIDEVEKLSE